MQHYKQVCIIGAGPAGLIASLSLAQKGIACTLIDKASFPRHKVCADNITGNTIRIIKELYPNLIADLVQEGKCQPIKGVLAHAANHHKVKIDFLPLEPNTIEDSCYAISRITLDNALMQKAKAHPLIEVWEGIEVKQLKRMNDGLLIKTTTTNIFTNLAIISSGSNASFYKDIHTVDKEDKHLAVGLRAYYKNVKTAEHKRYCELYLDKQLLPGGLYITPFADGSVNVNVVVRSDAVKRNKLKLKKILEHTLVHHPLLKERFADAQQIGNIEGASLLLGTKKRKISGDNFMLVGDAAGLIDLLSANGIPQAMLSAKIAAEFAESCVQSNSFTQDTLAEYDDRVFDRVKNYLKLSKFVAPFMSSRLALWCFMKLMNFVAKSYDKNDQIRDLIYDKDASKQLVKPKFYYRLFFGMKNTEGLK